MANANIDALNKILHEPILDGEIYKASTIDGIKITDANFDKYDKKIGETEFIPIEIDLILYDWDKVEPINDFSKLDNKTIKDIYKYFKSLSDDNLCFPCGLFIGKDKETNKILVYGVNSCCEKSEPNNILNILEEISSDPISNPNSNNNSKFPFLRLLNIMAFLGLIVGCTYLYLQNKSLKTHPTPKITSKPIIQKEILLDKDIISPDPNKIWSFYQKNFPDLFEKLTTNNTKDKDIKDLSKKLLVPNYISSLWEHYHKEFWLNRNISIQEKSSMLSRNILYDFFNKNKIIIKLVKNNKNKKLLKNTKFLRLYKVYTNNRFKQDIYYWSDSNFRIKNKYFINLLKEYNIENGWNWISEANSENFDLQFNTYGNIPVSVESLEAQDNILLAIINDEEAVFFKPNQSTMLRNSTYSKIKKDIKNQANSTDTIIWYKLDGSFTTGVVSYIKATSGEIAASRMLSLKNHLKSKNLVKIDKETLRLNNKKRPLIKQDGNTSCLQTGKGCGFHATDPIVAMLLFNFIDKDTIPLGKSKLDRQQAVINESHILMSEINDSGSAIFTFISSNKEIHNFFIGRNSFELIKENGEKIILNKITDNTFLDNYVYESNVDGTYFSVCIDNAKISNSPYIMKTVEENNKCNIELGESN